MIAGETIAKTADANQPAFLILDTETVPDGRLVASVKYPDENLSPEAAIEKAQAEARERSRDGSDFLPVSFQYPVSICVARVGPDFRLQALACLDAPHFRTREMVEAFWKGIARYHRAKLVTFNGRGFDMPLLELSAFRYGCCGLDYFQRSRNRFNGHVDLLDWLSNYGAYRLTGGLNLLSKILGKPGKMGITGDQVYAMHCAGQAQQINDYCLCDVIDTYFVFLRTRVLTGDISLEEEQELVHSAKSWLGARAAELPALRGYLDNWGGWQPWP
jgi:predicted PolB exonuclease-like 3'-5' exonuclease